MPRIALDPDELVRAATACETGAAALAVAAARVPPPPPGLAPGVADAGATVADAAGDFRSVADALADAASELRLRADWLGAIDVGPFGAATGTLVAGGAVLVADTYARPWPRSLTIAFDTLHVGGEVAVAAPLLLRLPARAAREQGWYGVEAALRRASGQLPAAAAAFDHPLVTTGGRLLGWAGVGIAGYETVDSAAHGRYVDASGSLLQAGGGVVLVLGASGPVGWVALAAVASGLAIQHRAALARVVVAGGRATWSGARWVGAHVSDGIDVARGRTLAAGRVGAQVASGTLEAERTLLAGARHAAAGVERGVGAALHGGDLRRPLGAGPRGLRATVLPVAVPAAPVLGGVLDAGHGVARAAAAGLHELGDLF